MTDVQRIRTERKFGFRDLVSKRGIGVVIVVLMAIQSICTFFFVSDIFLDLAEHQVGEPIAVHIWMEVIANVAMVTAIILEAEYLRQLLKRQFETERSLSVASGDLQRVIDEYFANWALTPAEADIALFAMKGCSISEIAQLRGSAEGTIKTHLNAIYRKAGVSGRAQLVSLLVEDLLGGPVYGRSGAGDGTSANRAANGT